MVGYNDSNYFSLAVKKNREVIRRNKTFKNDAT